MREQLLFVSTLLWLISLQLQEQSDHVQDFVNHNASHAFACGEIGTGINMSEMHVQKPTPAQRKKKSYSTPCINSGLDKHNRHKRVTPWK